MATSASEIFTNAYLKKMRRPEMGGRFNPDEAFGANLVHGSEMQNPSPTRNMTNALYGNMKTPMQGGSSINMGQPSSLLPTPNAGTDMAKVLGPNILSDWAGRKIRDMMDKPSGEFADSMKGVLGQENAYDQIGSKMFAPSLTESGLGGIEKAGESFSNTIPNPSSFVTPEVGSSILDGVNLGSVGAGVATAAAPMMMEKLTGSKLAGDITGTAATTGVAAAQGGLNPMSDLAALLSWAKLLGRAF